MADDDKTIYIRFSDRSAQARGYLKLALAGGVNSLRGGVYGVSSAAHSLLEEEGIPFEVVNEKELARIHAEIRGPSPSLLQ